MEFSNEFIKYFSKTKYNRLDRDEVLKITGVNYLGQPFSTTGIAMGNGYIDSDAIGIYLGQKNGSKYNYVTFFNTFMEGSKCLYVLSIERNGNIIYQNQDADKIIASTNNYASNLTSSSINLLQEEQQLTDLIAKPILIKGIEPITLKSVQKMTYNGKVKLEGTNGTFGTSYIINNPSDVKLDQNAINNIPNNLKEDSETEM